MTTSVETISVDPSFRSAAAEFYPNRIYGDGKEIGAIGYVVKAEAEGRIKQGFVVLAKQNGGRTLEYIGHARASEVAERLRNATPWEGKFGAYHWITEMFCTVSGVSDKPF